MEHDTTKTVLTQLRGFVEQLGAPSATWGPRAGDLLEKLVPGSIAKLKVARDDDLDGLEAVRPFIEQLGVASGKFGLRERGDLGMAVFGLLSKWTVTKYWGLDVRAEAYALIEERVMQLPIDVKRKALLLSTLYSIASRLPDLR